MHEGNNHSSNSYTTCILQTGQHIRCMKIPSPARQKRKMNAWGNCTGRIHSHRIHAFCSGSCCFCCCSDCCKLWLLLNATLYINNMYTIQNNNNRKTAIATTPKTTIKCTNCLIPSNWMWMWTVCVWFPFEWFLIKLYSNTVATQAKVTKYLVRLSWFSLVFGDCLATPH